MRTRKKASIKELRTGNYQSTTFSEKTPFGAGGIFNSRCPGRAAFYNPKTRTIIMMTRTDVALSLLLSESTHPCAPLSSSPTGESGTVPVEDTQARGSGGVGQRQVPMLDLIMILMQLVWLRVLPQHMGTRLTDLSSTRWQKCSRTSAKSPPSSTTSPPPSPSSGRAPVCQTPHAPRLCVLTFVVALL